MAGIFDLKKGAFDSSEAAVLNEAFAIAVHGLRASHDVDTIVTNRLARSILKVARGEFDTMRNDGTLDPARIAQRAILRMLQVSAPRAQVEVDEVARPASAELVKLPVGPDGAPIPPEGVGKIMQRLFDRTPFAKL